MKQTHSIFLVPFSNSSHQFCHASHKLVICSETNGGILQLAHMLEVFHIVSVGDGEINQLAEVLIQYYFIGNA